MVQERGSVWKAYPGVLFASQEAPHGSDVGGVLCLHVPPKHLQRSVPQILGNGNALFVGDPHLHVIKIFKPSGLQSEQMLPMLL